MDIFAERLTQIIDETGLSRAEVCRILDIHPPTLSKYLHGKSGMSLETLKKVCKTFNVSANWLLGISNIKGLR